MKYVFYYMRPKYVFLLMFTLSLFFQESATAQATAVHTDPQLKFKKARAFYMNEQFTLAIPLLLELQQEFASMGSIHKNPMELEVDFYFQSSRLQVFDERGVVPSRDFISYNDHPVRTSQLSYFLGSFYFRNQNYAEALEYYEKAAIEHLNNNQIAELKFQMAYCYFYDKKFKEAKPLFNTIRRIPNDRHVNDAHYYYGFIAYNDRDYNEALQSFEKVKKHPQYGQIVPFYLASIYYFRGQKDKAIQIAEEAIQRKSMLYVSEMKQLLGHAYFEKKDYQKALLYLEPYVNNNPKVSRDDLYKISFCYYQNNQYNKAIDGFKQLSGSEDSLSQNAMYLLGDAYLKTGQKENARNAFAFCASNSSNPLQKEISLFHYAKLSFELGYQGVAITEFKRFLEQYPSSSYLQEAKELLVALLAGTSNFKDAITLIESLNNPSEATRKLYPVILYGRAAELINDHQLIKAELLLDKILKLEFNSSVLPLVQYWKGEIAYRNNRLDEAIGFYNSFLQSGHKGIGEASPKEAHYNLGHCYLRKENYTLALGFFQKVVSSVKLSAPQIEQDAFTRQGDCHFMLRNYKQALTHYQQVIDFSWPNADYAMYQKAMIQGISNSKSKIDILNSLQRMYPSSSLVPDANMEIAKAYMADEQFKSALPYLNYLVQLPQNNGYRQIALLQLGIVYYNLDKNEEALNQYKKLLVQYPNTDEADQALENIRTIYIETGRPQEYEAFIRSTGKNISQTEADSLAYAAVEIKLNNNDCQGLLVQADNYLNRFPNGYHTIDVQYYRSECLMQRKDWKGALPGYVFVAKQGNSRFAERSALLAARTYYFELQDYAAAQPLFEQLRLITTTDDNRLEALRGLLRCHYQLKKYDAATEVAKELLNHKNAGNDDKALSNLVTGRNYQTKNQWDLAIQSYRSVVSLNKGEWAAEARYEIARSYFELGTFNASEKAAFEVIKKSGSYDLWVTRSYILLGDIYFKQKDFFNAKATYQSVADNAINQDLKTEAQKKLQIVIEEEKKNSKIEG